MGIVRWCFAATVALLKGSGLFSGSIVLGACVAVVVLLVAAYLSWEERLLGPETREARSRSTRLREYGGVYGEASDGGSITGGGCGFGGEGGGSFGGDGGGAGGC